LRSAVEIVNVTVSFKKTLSNYVLSIIMISEDSRCGIRKTPAMTEPQLPESRFVTTFCHFDYERFLIRSLP
jgi:hypothetical protein